MTEEKSWSDAEEKVIETIMKEKKVSHAVAARLMHTAADSKSRSTDKVLAKVAKAIKWRQVTQHVPRDGTKHPLSKGFIILQPAVREVVQ